MLVCCPGNSMMRTWGLGAGQGASEAPVSVGDTGRADATLGRGPFLDPKKTFVPRIRVSEKAGTLSCCMTTRLVRMLVDVSVRDMSTTF